jgi:hypothetical protein
MKVSHAIKLLSEIDPDEEICISWWERDLFTDRDRTPVSDDTWHKAVAVFDANGGYDTINQQVWEFINYDINEEGEF